MTRVAWRVNIQIVIWIAIIRHPALKLRMINKAISNSIRIATIRKAIRRQFAYHV